MNNEDISSKKLTLQGFNKLKLGLDLNSSASPGTGATIVKKRRRKPHETEEQDGSKLGSLTEKEQIFRINAVQNAALLKEKNLKEEKEVVVKEDNDKKVDDKDGASDAAFKEIEEKASSGVSLAKPMEGGVDDEDNDKKTFKD